MARLERDFFIFVSYRRADSGAAVRAVSATLRQAFGAASVFVDTETIKAGEQWPERVTKALRKATVAIITMGPTWLRDADDYGRRRLDLPGDWVRQEIEALLDRNIPLIPLTVGRAKLPTAPALPESITRIVEHQAYEVRDEYWEQDLLGLMLRLEALGCRRVAADVHYPKPHVWPKELTQKELKAALRELPQWRVQTSTIAGREPNTQTELVRTFQFPTFEKVVDFMGKAAPYISNMNHHPRWENIYCSLTVCLTTWDIGFRPSRFDVELAGYLDRLYRNYEKQPARRKRD
ncbi:MAG TPA: 4a-hydroxytetrahydrobiopterin dehydratase [Thermoanaerobaculia bacterium]|nr:4a-hydroxytetrahydrobiopterin dehydratase [Thermoanaerobaculia bacterium]